MGTGTGAPGGAGAPGGERIRREEFRVSGSELLERFKELLHEGNIRRVLIKQDGRIIAEFPLTLGVVGAIFAQPSPPWAPSPHWWPNAPSSSRGPNRPRFTAKAQRR